MRAAPREWRQAQARVSRQVDFGPGHRWLDLDIVGPFVAPRPGQFVQLLLPATANPVLLPRPMSVAAVSVQAGAGKDRAAASRARRAAGLRIGFLFAPVGLGTLALAALEPGAVVEVLGPLGRGYPLEHSGTPVLIAGGRGLAPLLFAADSLAGGPRAPGRVAHRPRRGARGRVPVMLFGARDRAHLVGLAEAHRRLAALGGRLHVCTDDGSLGPRADVVKLLERVAPTLRAPLVIHACGPHAMLKAVARWALAGGVPAFLAMESQMACGTGVCRGCPLPRSARARAAFDAVHTPSLYGNREWAMCCTEGPVFEAGDLDWDRVE